MFNKEKLSIYIHYPFCLSKCPYCDFNSYKINKKDFDEEIFISSYIEEINYYYKLLSQRQIETIFFGGGTPSLMSLKMLEKILLTIDNNWGINKNVEISLEVNPTSAEIEKFSNYKKLGINRISIGIQSLNEKDLKFLGRMHSVDEAKNAIKMAEKFFNTHYSIDLIYARPKQKLKEWLIELEECIKLSPYHISLYQLIIEEGTKFFEKNIQTLNDTKANKMYKETNLLLQKYGIECYEVSNYAKNGYECKHNLNYWNSGEWIGIGAGAHSRICFDGKFDNDYLVRTAIENFSNVKMWIDSVKEKNNGAENICKLTKEEFLEEILLMGLRTKQGINIANVKKYLNIQNIEDIAKNKDNLQFLQKNNYIYISDKNICMNSKYINLLNSIIEKLI